MKSFRGIESTENDKSMFITVADNILIQIKVKNH